jgi:hypothetical protein
MQAEAVPAAEIPARTLTACTQIEILILAFTRFSAQ